PSLSPTPPSPPPPPLFPYTTLFRSDVLSAAFLLPSVYFYLRARGERSLRRGPYVASLVFFSLAVLSKVNVVVMPLFLVLVDMVSDRKSTRLNSSHVSISYAVFCLKK